MTDIRISAQSTREAQSRAATCRHEWEPLPEGSTVFDWVKVEARCSRCATFWAPAEAQGGWT